MREARGAGSKKEPRVAPSSPDSTSGRSPDSPGRQVHLTPGTGSRDPRRHRFDAVVAAFVAACRAEVLSERTIEFYLEALNSYRAFAGGAVVDLTLADLGLDRARAGLVDFVLIGREKVRQAELPWMMPTSTSVTIRPPTSPRRSPAWRT